MMDTCSSNDVARGAISSSVKAPISLSCSGGRLWSALARS